MSAIIPSTSCFIFISFLNINLYLKSNLVISTNLSYKDILSGIIGCEDEIFVNHILLLAKQYVYSCRQNKYSPSIRVLNSKINTAVFLIETLAVVTLQTFYLGKHDLLTVYLG